MIVSLLGTIDLRNTRRRGPTEKRYISRSLPFAKINSKATGGIWKLMVMCFVCMALCPAGWAAETLTYVDLVNRMLDLERLAVLPEPGEGCAQWSSYDRASKYDPATGKYINWGANGDGNGIIRKEGNLSVMAEMEGPGCIWRIWSARAQNGRVKIYLDGQEQPTIDMPFIHYFDGKHAPFNFPMLSYEMRTLGSAGENLYFPIPYQRSCKIVAEDGWGQYYHFTYTTFPKGTKVPTFKPQLSAEEIEALKRVDGFFREKLGTDPAGQRKDEKTETRQVRAEAGKTVPVVELAGPRAITAIKVKMNFAGRDDEVKALRRLVLRITFDGQQQPSVWCPLGDFFGTTPGVNKYRTLVTGMTDEGFYSYWYMPFNRSALVELVNDDQTAREAVFEVVHAPLSRPMDTLGYFHAKWHRDIFPVSKDRQPDWVMLKTEGRGRFCGVMLHVWNPRGNWWGEGDEKFFVDGEKFPSTIGTGSEDYFGYAWCHPGRFERPYHAQTMTENNKGHQSVLRWHVVDNVPFQKSFEACIEKYFPNSRPTLYACVPVWYLAAGGVDPIEAVPVDQRDGYCVVPPLDGGIRVIGSPKGNVEVQDMAHFGQGKWKNDDQLWWTRAKPGDKLELGFTVDKSGKYQVSVLLTKARDYAIVQLYLDGNKIGEPIDLYNPDVVPTGPISLGTHELSKGEHRMTVEIVGANEKAIKAYMFGLDRIVLEPAK